MWLERGKMEKRLDQIAKWEKEHWFWVGYRVAKEECRKRKRKR